MTRQDFIKNFKLTRTKTKCIFYDGMSRKERSLYINTRGTLYIIYNNDLHYVEPYKEYEYFNGMKEIKCRLCGAYSWYH